MLGEGVVGAFAPVIFAAFFLGEAFAAIMSAFCLSRWATELSLNAIVGIFAERSFSRATEG